MKETGLSTLLRSSQTVFSFKEISLLWRETDPRLVARRVHHYVASGKLIRLRKGIYARDKDYDRYEFIVKIYTPSYVSFETILTREGMMFQYYDTMFAASYLTRTITCGGQRYAFRSLKHTILTNPHGIIQKGSVSYATRERAFLDMLYINRRAAFDNYSTVDWKQCFELVSLYQSSSLKKLLNEFAEQYRHA